MKEYVLNYYPKFKCVADKCKHTCCAGWEISIDKNSLDEYMNCDSNFLSALKKGINYKKSKFKVDKFKRCAFLNADNLCEIIINLGEKSLCQVCKDHPRFRSFFDDRTETGIGFCCEEAARIILSFQDRIDLVTVGDDKGQTELDFNQKNILEFREKALDTLQDRTVNINDRIDRLLTLCNASIRDLDFGRILKTFLSFERLDKTWTNRLKSIKNFTKKSTEEYLSIMAEQFLVNCLYRHLSDAEDTMWVRARTIACVISWWIINHVVLQEKTDEKDLLELVVDVVRAFSAEVEYSKNNLDKLFSFCYNFIKI